MQFYYDFCIMPTDAISQVAAIVVTNIKKSQKTGVISTYQIFRICFFWTDFSDIFWLQQFLNHLIFYS